MSKRDRKTELERLTGIPEELHSILQGAKEYSASEQTVIFARFLEDKRYNNTDRENILASLFSQTISPKEAKIYTAISSVCAKARIQSVVGYGVDHSQASISECLRVEKSDLAEHLNELKRMVGKLQDPPDEKLAGRVDVFLGLSIALLSRDIPLLIKAYHLALALNTSCEIKVATLIAEQEKEIEEEGDK